MKIIAAVSAMSLLAVGWCFAPGTATMDAGGEVAWANDDAAAHTVAAVVSGGGPDAAFGSGLVMPGASLSHGFGDTGGYAYFSMIHPWMAGAVVVEDVAGGDGAVRETPDAKAIRLAPVSAVFDGSGGFEALYLAWDVEVLGMEGRTYAMVAALHDHGVQVIDITDPAHPVPISAAFDGMNGFEALNGAADVEVFGMEGRTYAMVAAWIDDGVQIIDVTDPAHPAPISAVFDGMNGFEALGGAADVEVFGVDGRTYAIVAAYDSHGVQIIDVTDPAHPTPVSAAFDDVGGFGALFGAEDVEVFGMDGRTYAIVTAQVDDGVQVIDITDPAHPAPFSAAFDGRYGFEALGGAEDVEVFGMDGRTYAVVAAQRDGGVQIMDITDQANMVPVSAAFDDTGGFEALNGATDVEVFGMDGRTYAVVAAQWDNGVQIINITDPAHPAPVSAAFDDTGGFEALYGAADVEVFGMDGRTYVVVAAWADDGVQVIEVSAGDGQPSTPPSVGPVAEDPTILELAPVSAAFNDRGGLWALGGAADVEAFGMYGRTYAIVTAQVDDGVQIINITDPAHPAPVSAAFDSLGGFEALGGAADVEVFGMGGRTYAMVAARDDDGVHIIDVTDPANMAPVSVAFDGMNGFEALGGAADVEVFGMEGRTYAMVAALHDHGVQVIDITDPAHPVPISVAFDGMNGFEALGGAADVEVFGMEGRTYAMVAALHDHGVQVIDITDPAHPVPISAVFDGMNGFEALGGAEDAVVFGVDGRTYAMVAALHDHGVQVINMTDPAHPAPTSAAFDGSDGFWALGGAADVEVFGMDGRTYVMVAARDDGGVQVLDITNPANMAPASAAFDSRDGFGALGWASGVDVFGMDGRTYALVAAAADGGVQIVEIYAGDRRPSAPPAVGHVAADPTILELAPVSAAFDGMDGFEALDGAEDVEVFGMDGRTYAIVAAHGDNGVQVINITDPANMAPVSAVYDDTGGFEALDGGLGGAYGVEAFWMHGRTYAIVAAGWDNGVQIINMTDPANPTPMSAAFDSKDGYGALGGAEDVEVFGMDGRTYAIVAAYRGVQVIDITDPANMVLVSDATDGKGGFEALDRAEDVEVFGMDGRTYAVVAAQWDNGVQIMDITDPAHPAPISAAFDDIGGFDALGGVWSVEVFGMDGRTYAVVAASTGVQMIDITDPSSPAPVSAARDGREGFKALGQATDVEVFGMDGRTYAVVAVVDGDGVQVIDVTNPADMAPVSAAYNGWGGFEALNGAYDVEVFGMDGRTYAVVAAADGDGVQVIEVSAGDGQPSTPPSVGPVAADPTILELAPVSAALDGRGGFEALRQATGVEVFDMYGRTYAVVAAWDDDGVQVINMTDPANPTPVSAAFDDTGGFGALDGALGVEVFGMDGRTYAVVASYGDGVQVINMTDPANLAPVSAAFDDTGGFEARGWTAAVEVFGMDGRTYAVVAAYEDGRVQIINITDPANPAPISAAFDDTGGFEALGGAYDMEVFGMDGRTYAIVAAAADGGVQVMDITDPARIIPVSAALDDTGGFEALGGANGVEVFWMDGLTYAIVTALYDDGVQVMDITDPARIIPVSAAFDGSGGFWALEGAYDVEVFDMYGRTYAIVAAYKGVQVIDITDPANMVPVSDATDGRGGFGALDRTRDVEVFDMYGRTYAIVAAGGDGGVQIVEIYAGG